MARARSTTRKAPPRATAPRVTTRAAPEQQAVTVPGTMTLLSTAKVGHDTTLRHATADVRRAIPGAKLAAVKTQLDASGRFSIDYGGAVTPYRDGRGFRIQFWTAKTEAELGSFLATIESAITT